MKNFKHVLLDPNFLAIEKQNNLKWARNIKKLKGIYSTKIRTNMENQKGKIGLLFIFYLFKIKHKKVAFLDKQK